MRPIPRSNTVTRLPRSGRRGWWTGLAAAAAVLVILLTFPTMWLRPLAQHFVRGHAGRQIDFDRVRFGLNADLQPVVRLRNLQIENAAWAAPRPLIRAAEFDVTVAWESLRGHGTVVPLLVIADGDIDLEQQADGLRNWRLANPQDRGPGKVRIQSLQADRSRMWLRLAGQNLEMALATAPLVSPRLLSSRPDLPMTQSLKVSGRRGNTSFDGEFDISQVLTFFDTGRPFPLAGHLHSGPSQVALEGMAQDLLQFAGFDVAMHLTGSDLGALGAVFAARSLPPIAVVASGKVHKDGPHWTVSDLQARAGHSDLSGTLEFDRPADRTLPPTLRATLAAERLDWAELRPPAASGHALSTPASTPPAAPRHPDDLDGDIDLKVAKLDGLPLGRIGPLASLHLHLAMHAGQLRLSPLSFAVAGGHADGSVTVTTTRSPLDASVDMQFRGLRLDALAGPQAPDKRPDGGLDLHVALQSHGDSYAALRDGVAGHLSASLTHATLPAAMEAKLALDGGQWLRSMLQPGDRVALTCAVADMDVHAGQGHSRRLAIETDNVVVNGTAAVDLPHESFDLVLTPHRKHTALLALNKSVRLSGTFKQPKIGLVAGDDAAGNAGCTSGPLH